MSNNKNYIEFWRGLAFIVPFQQIKQINYPKVSTLWLKKKRIVKIAVHYRHASQPPEWQPTGTPTACTIIELEPTIIFLRSGLRYLYFVHPHLCKIQF